MVACSHPHCPPDQLPPTPKSGKSILKYSCDYDTPLIQNCPPKIQSKSINMTLGGHLATSSRNALPLMAVIPSTPTSSGALSVPSPFLPRRDPHWSPTLPSPRSAQPSWSPLPQSSLLPSLLRTSVSLTVCLPVMSPAMVCTYELI